MVVRLLDDILAWSNGKICIAKPILEVLPFNFLFYSVLASFRKRPKTISMVQSDLICETSFTQ